MENYALFTIFWRTLFPSNFFYNDKALYFFGLTLANHIWHMGVSPRDDMSWYHDLDTTLKFDLEVKLIGFLTCFRVRPITFL